jgi:hypothetical protein
MKNLIGFILFIVFLFLSGIHIYWGLGGKWGIDAAIPTKRDNEKLMKPGLFECFAVALGLLGFGIFSLIKARVILFRLPAWLLNYGLWLIAALFLIRAIGEFKYVGFFKKVNTTKFGKMDTKYYSPLCLSIALSAIILEFMTPA